MLSSYSIKKLFSRLISYAAALLILVSLIFVLIRVAPGDPAQKYISPELSPKLVEKIREDFSLDKPIFDQYVTFVTNVIQGDFGVSYHYREPVMQVIAEPLKFTVIFALLSLTIQLILAFLLVFLFYKYQFSLINKALNGLTYCIYSVPTMLIAIVLIYIFSLKLGLLPSSDLVSLDHSQYNLFNKLIDYLSHLALPLITISIPGVVIFYNYMKSSIETTNQSSFILFLRANGEPEDKIFLKHILPNSVGPLISVIGVELGILLGGVLITETIFSLPGMGRLTVTSILTRDYPLVVAAVFVSGVGVLLSNLIADLVKSRFTKN